MRWRSFMEFLGELQERFLLFNCRWHIGLCEPVLLAINIDTNSDIGWSNSCPKKKWWHCVNQFQPEIVYLHRNTKRFASLSPGFKHIQIIKTRWPNLASWPPIFPWTNCTDWVLSMLPGGFLPSHRQKPLGRFVLMGLDIWIWIWIYYILSTRSIPVKDGF